MFTWNYKKSLEVLKQKGKTIEHKGSKINKYSAYVCRLFMQVDSLMGLFLSFFINQTDGEQRESARQGNNSKKGCKLINN